ncbi:MAG: DUF4239 domain-containing protein [Ignavibacteriae bacterium]|nr:DUF4239 domain-containing protein [Ignavibacteriota bacterium]
MVKMITLPIALEMIGLIVLCLAVTITIFFFIRKKFTHEKVSENHTIASYIFNAFSISYGVLLAFVVYANWYDNNRAHQNVAYEVSYISNFYRDTRTLQDSLKKIITGELINYTKSVLEDEWFCLSEGKSSTKTDTLLDNLWNSYLNIPADKIPNQQLFQVSLERLNYISQYRRLRILDMQQTTPGVMWVVLAVCFSVSLAYAYFFMTKQRKAHLLLVITFIIINTLIFYLIYVLDHPYRFNSGISSEPFRTVLNKISTGK